MRFYIHHAENEKQLLYFHIAVEYIHRFLLKTFAVFQFLRKVLLGEDSS